MNKILVLMLLLSSSLPIFSQTTQVIKNMIEVPGGKYYIGNDKGSLKEKPEHEISLNSFYISKYETTDFEFNEIVGDFFYIKKYDIELSKKMPAYEVPYIAVLIYCNKLSKLNGLEEVYIIDKANPYNIKYDYTKNGYRLPTEAEWEVAANSGLNKKEFLYSGSNNIDEIGWYNLNSENKMHEIGTKLSNKLGIYDITGNVYEICIDSFDFFNLKEYLNPINKPTESNYKISIRGGDFKTRKNISTISDRCGFYPFNTNGNPEYIGFRLARNK